MEELAHVELVRQAILQLGGDPALPTPSAAVTSVASGLLRTITDPRTDLRECLDVMLTAELTDNDAWEMLARLAREVGHEELSEDFVVALRQERGHLSRVRRWVSSGVGRAKSEKRRSP